MRYRTGKAPEGLVRTVISLDEGDKLWLDRQAARRKVPMTQLVREAVALMRRAQAAPGTSPERLLERTQGIWKGADGLRWQNRVRDEW